MASPRSSNYDPAWHSDEETAFLVLAGWRICRKHQPAKWYRSQCHRCVLKEYFVDPSEVAGSRIMYDLLEK